MSYMAPSPAQKSIAPIMREVEESRARKRSTMQGVGATHIGHMGSARNTGRGQFIPEKPWFLLRYTCLSFAQISIQPWRSFNRAYKHASHAEFIHQQCQRFLDLFHGDGINARQHILLAEHSPICQQLLAHG